MENEKIKPTGTVFSLEIYKEDGDFWWVWLGEEYGDAGAVYKVGEKLSSAKIAEAVKKYLLTYYGGFED